MLALGSAEIFVAVIIVAAVMMIVVGVAMVVEVGRGGAGKVKVEEVTNAGWGNCG